MSATKISPILLTLLLAGCSSGSSGPQQPDAGGSSPSPTGTRPTDESTIRSGLLRPSDLRYRGAFRLPDGSDGATWEWGGGGLTYYPAGDAAGPPDGCPGSLFGIGHDQYQWVSEVSIPAPVVSATKALSELRAATTLQDFRDVKARLNIGELELPCGDLAYLPPQGSQTTGKLHFCWGQHYQEQQAVSHGWCELDLSNPQTAGGWYLGDLSNYSTNGYLFDIPETWAAAHTPGMRLATGRFRDGGWSGQGPALFAYGPWNQGDPPAPGTRLDCGRLLLYTSSADLDAQPHTLSNYHHSDEWSGGAWLTAGSRSAVIFVGTKGTGQCWYGFGNGVVWPDEPPYPPIPDPPYDDRGWWSSGFVGQFVFYDPADLAAVAAGQVQPYGPQPYATLNIDDHLFGIRSAQQKHHLGAAAFDRQRGLLYVFEPRADGDKPLVHVWQVEE